MKLFELMNSDIPVQFGRDTESSIYATFNIGGQPYVFTTDRWYDDTEVGGWVWQVEFYIRGNLTSHSTGTGNELKVFAAVKKCMMHLVQKIEQQGQGVILYSATTTEPSRVKIYGRFAKELGGRPGWHNTQLKYPGWFQIDYEGPTAS